MASGEPVRNPADRRDVVGHARHAARAEIEAALATAAAAASAWACDERASGRLSPARRGRHGSAYARPDRTDRARGRQVVPERHRGGARGGRLPALLRCARRAARSGPTGTRRSGRRLHLALELPAGDLHRPGRGGARGRQPCPGEARRGDAAGRGRSPCVSCTRPASRPTCSSLLPGAGEVGAALVADARVMGVMFTGSTAVARLIQRQLAERLTPAGQPVPLIAETGGQNAMVVDSSALAEQVVADVIASAFD